MPQWEYLTVLLNADALGVEAYLADHFAGWQVGRYSPVALVPYLNEYGAQGWELVSVQPVASGSDEAIMIHNGSADGPAGRIWSHTYLCAFRRPKS